MSPEVFESLARSVIEEADAGIMWAKAWFTVGFFILSIGVFVFFEGTFNNRKKDDTLAATAIISVIGLVIGATGGCLMLMESLDKKNNILAEIHQKSEWHMMVVRPAEEAALRSIIEEYERRGLKSSVWTSFQEIPMSLPTQSQASFQD
jgi:hypothetical protein